MATKRSLEYLKHCCIMQPACLHSQVFLVNPRFRFFMAANEPAMVSLIFSPAAAALDLAEAPLPPPNLHVFPIKHHHIAESRFSVLLFR